MRFAAADGAVTSATTATMCAVIEDYAAKRRRERRIARSLLIGGIVLAFAAAALTYVYATTRPLDAAPVPTVSVLVAARDLPPRTALSAGDVKVVKASPDLVPPGTFSDPGAVVGRIVTVPIVANEVILPSKFAAAEGFGFSVFPPGQQPAGSAPDFRAMSLNIPDAQAVGGAVQPGDAVDLIFTLTFEPAQAIPGAPTGQPVDFAARIVFERVPILARTLTIYTIRIEAAQAERIAALQAAGSTVQLLLRARTDDRDARASGARYSQEALQLIRGIPTRPR